MKQRLLLACMAGVLSFGVQATTAQPDAEKAGAQTEQATTPVLEIETLDDGLFRLEDQRGRWVVINYWATWCTPCLKEIPDLYAFSESRDDVVVIGLAYEDIGADEMRAFLKKHPAGYPIAIVDVYDPPADFPAPRGLPMTWLIAPDGTIAKRFLGPVTGRDLAGEIEKQGEASH